VHRGGVRHADLWRFAISECRRLKFVPRSRPRPNGASYARRISAIITLNADTGGPPRMQRARIAWRFKTDSLGPGQELQVEARRHGHGVLYATPVTRRSVVGARRATGEGCAAHAE